MNPLEDFRQSVSRNIDALASDTALLKTTLQWIIQSNAYGYTYNHTWLGRPIIQYPQDMVAVQELIWQIKPDLIIETGIAHGGSLILSASMLALIEYADAAAVGAAFDPRTGRSRVLGIDIDIRIHNREAIEAHPLAHKIDMIQGSSIDPEVVAKVHDYASHHDKILILLDSMHTHAHVLSELEAYALLTSPGSYCVVFDTLIEDLPPGMFPDRPWGKGNNPKTAVWEYLDTHPEFEIDKSIQHKLIITVAPDGYLRRLR